jgi:hypothetical protein
LGVLRDVERPWLPIDDADGRALDEEAGERWLGKPDPRRGLEDLRFREKRGADFGPGSMGLRPTVVMSSGWKRPFFEPFFS